MTLGPLALVSPAMTGQELSIDANSLDLVFDAPLTAVSLEVTLGDRVITSSVAPVKFGGKMRFTVSITDIIPSMTALQVLVVGKDYLPTDDGTHGPYGITPTYAFRLIYTPVVSALPNVDPPSGVKAYKGLNTAKVEWVRPEVEGFLGVRVQYSVDSTGINTPYQQYGPLVTRITRFLNDTIAIEQTRAVEGNQTTTTTVEQTMPVNYSSVTFPQSIAGGADNFYVVLSTVIQDPQTNHIYESNYNGPFQLGFVDLRQVNPADFPYLQQKEDVASRLISSAMANYPDLDLTPRSEIRDLHIDPISLEISQQSVREWFARCSESISAIATLDDYDGDGFSDEFNTNPFKPQIARAWNLAAADVQYLIDNQFDILGERAGLLRGPATTAIAMVTLYTYSKPTATVTLNAADIIVSSNGDGQTPSLNYLARGSAVIDPQSLEAIYNPEKGWWGIQIPAECSISGSIGNVGAGTITQAISGIPSGWLVTNLAPAQYGTDRESNAKYAERIKDRLVVGIDTGRRLGYLNTARSTPGVIDANVVASGDLEMLRDWFPASNQPGGGKHIFGTVDVYVRGTNFVQQTNRRAFTWQNSSDTYRDFGSYVEILLSNKSRLEFKSKSALPLPIYTLIEIVATRGTDQIVLGTKLAKIDPSTNTFFLEPTEKCQKIVGDGVAEHYEYFQLNGADATNRMVIDYITSQAQSVQYKAWVRLISPLQHIPTFQPVTSAFSVVGAEGQTGSIHVQNVRLIRSQDPLLEGFSNRATDTIRIDTDSTVPVVKTMVFATGDPDTQRIDSDMKIRLDTLGRLFDINSVRSEDLATLYVVNVDYALVPSDRYNTFSLKRIATGAIPLDANILVAYNKYQLHEYCNQIVDEPVVLAGTAQTPLANAGFVQNVWLPESYGFTNLSMDGWNADPNLYTGMAAAYITKQNRFIKVTYDDGTGPKVMVEHRDYNLHVDAVTNQAYLSRVMTGRIPDNTAVLVSYFTTEVFAITTGYPGFVQQVSYAVEQSRHAAADVLVKQMIENSVDVILSVELNSNVTPEIMDGRIRTVIGVVLSNARGRVTQAEIIRQVKALPGIANVIVPVSKFAKSDGSYNIGHIIPTATPWIPINSDERFASKSFPAKTWITTNQVLTDMTIPSGGTADAYVGMLYEGLAFRRASSLQDFIANPPTADGGAFYIIGIDDQIDPTTPLDPSYAGRIVCIVPDYLSNPAYLNFKVTYQVWREGGYKDITLSPTEYLRMGRVTIDYV